jgi:hypothetical protein
MTEQKAASYNLTIANGAAVSTAFNTSDFIGGIVIIPTSWTDANMGFKVCDTEGGTFVALKDDDGAPVQIAAITTDAPFAYKIPNEIFPAMWVKLWSKSTTAATVTDTNQSGDITITVMLK